MVYRKRKGEAQKELEHGIEMADFPRGDFRMNMLCHTLITDIKMDTADIGPNLRPEVAEAFTDVLQAIKKLSDVTNRLLEQNGRQSSLS